MKIAVAMSGGFNSSLAAVMLKKMGHDVMGLTVNFTADLDYKKSTLQKKHTYSPERVVLAKRVAKQFGFSHKIINCSPVSQGRALDYNCIKCLNGSSFYPCIIYNSKMIIEKLFSYARIQGCSKICTGHYARLCGENGKRHWIARGLDIKNDQSFLLFTLTQHMLGVVLLPLGDYHFDGIKKLAGNFGLPALPDFEIGNKCFIQKDSHPEYIEKIKKNTLYQGNILTNTGDVIAKHNGIAKYSIGDELREHSISAEEFFVTDIDLSNNIIIAGPVESLYCKEFLATNITYMAKESLNELEVFVKIGKSQDVYSAKLKEYNNGVKVYLDKQQKKNSSRRASDFL